VNGGGLKNENISIEELHQTEHKLPAEKDENRDLDDLCFWKNRKAFSRSRENEGNDENSGSIYPFH
jgi:hypothetical protein